MTRLDIQTSVRDEGNYLVFDMIYHNGIQTYGKSIRIEKVIIYIFLVCGRSGMCCDIVV